MTRPRGPAHPVAAAVGEVILRRRKSAHLKLDAVATETGVSAQHLSAIETGRTGPSLASVFVLALALRTLPETIIAEARELLASKLAEGGGE